MEFSPTVTSGSVQMDSCKNALMYVMDSASNYCSKTALKLAFLSGGQGGATEVRAKQLGINHCLVGIKDKPSALAQLQTDLGIAQQQTGFIGDDLNDLAVRKQINLLITPADACAAVRRQADWVLSRNCGQGAVREAAEAILNSRGTWRSLRSRGWRERND